MLEQRLKVMEETMRCFHPGALTHFATTFPKSTAFQFTFESLPDCGTKGPRQTEPGSTADFVDNEDEFFGEIQEQHPVPIRLLN